MPAARSVVPLRVIEPAVWYSSAEAGAILDCGPRHLHRECAAGRLRGARINARGDYRFKGSWILSWLERRTKEVA